MTEVKSPYPRRYHNDRARRGMRSAVPVLGILRDLYSPTSIVDIGCGSGTWLAAAESLGFTVMRGYDAPWADSDTVEHGNTNVEFVAVDLETVELKHDRTYDLAMSVEVAEHLSGNRADFIVDALCSASDVVLFGAAIPYQGGVHHVHEMPQTYWIERFLERGFEPFDIIRPAIWNNDNIARWYRQNTLVFVKEGSDVVDRAKLHSMEARLWDVVHPASFVDRTTALRKQVAELRRERETLQKQVVTLEGQMATMRPPSRVSLQALRSLRPTDLPEPLRPAAVAVWRRLPSRARSLLRPSS